MCNLALQLIVSERARLGSARQTLARDPAALPRSARLGSPVARAKRQASGRVHRQHPGLAGLALLALPPAAARWAARGSSRLEKRGKKQMRRALAASALRRCAAPLLAASRRRRHHVTAPSSAREKTSETRNSALALPW